MLCSYRHCMNDTSHDDIHEGEVLWIGPDICRIPELSDGFALRVLHLLGWGELALRPVWVRGVVLDRWGVPTRYLTLCVPANQHRAVRVGHRPSPVPAGGARHRVADDDRDTIGPPPGYRRVLR
jgi:hypothetical protein